MLPCYTCQLTIFALLLLQRVVLLPSWLHLQQHSRATLPTTTITLHAAAGIAHDLMLECCAIGEGRRACPSLLGDLRIRPVLPETGYDVPLDRYILYCYIHTIFNTCMYTRSNYCTVCFISI
jgi:hypothetical protein